MDTPTRDLIAALRAQIATLAAHQHAANQRLADHDQRLANLEHADAAAAVPDPPATPPRRKTQPDPRQP